MGTQPRCVQTPMTMSHSGSLTRTASVCGWRISATLAWFSSAIMASVRRLMKTGLPRHLTVMTWPGCTAARSTSTAAMASTSAEAESVATVLITARRAADA